MTHKQKTILLSIAGVIGVLVLAVLLFDWNLLRGYIERQVEERSGRACEIGHLDVDLGLTPRIHVRGFRLANAEWAREEWMLDIDRFDFDVRLLPLLKGDVVVPRVSLSRPFVALEKSADGARNWILKQDQKPQDRPPVLERLIVNEGVLVFRDPTLPADLRAEVQTDSASQEERPFKFKVGGTFKGMPARIEGEGGAVLNLRDIDLPYPIKGTIAAGATRASLEGTVTGLVALAGVDLRAELRGEDLSDLHDLTGVALPATPPYHIAGHLTRQADLWRLADFKGKVGDSDLAGDFQLAAAERKKITADLRSRVLDVDDLAGFIGAPPKTGAGETASAQQKRKAQKVEESGRVLPDHEYDLEKLRAMDADVRLQAASIRREGLPLDDLTVHLVLDEGVLRLDPLNFGVAGGNIVSGITLNARTPKIDADARISLNKLHLNRLFPNLETTRASVGTFSGRAALKGRGNSFARMLGSADGNIAAVMDGGQISNLILEILGIDGGEIIRFLLGGDRNATLRCAVADFDVEDGLMTSKVLVFDTTDTNIGGEGTVNLKTEALDLTFFPQPKDVSVLSGRAPLHVKGTFQNPEFSPDRKILAARGGAAAVLGALVGPLAALIPLIETGPGKDSDCRELIAQATRDIAKQEKK